MNHDERESKRTDGPRRRKAYERPAVVDFGDAESLTQTVSGAYI